MNKNHVCYIKGGFCHPFFIFMIYLIKRIFALLLLFYSVICFSSSSETLPVNKNKLVFSFDQIEVVENEKMGLLGGSYLFPMGAGFYTGLGVYGAVTGDRGGFFTGGLQLTWDKALTQEYFFSAQLFGGGGGGGAAPQGGGLMYRTSMEIGKNFTNNRVAAGISYINFPNGEIESHQLTFSYSRYFDNLHLSGYRPPSAVLNSWRKALNKGFSSTQQTFSLQFLSYYPDDENKGRSGKALKQRMDMLGVRWSRKLKNNYWFEFETAGAVSGGIDGFAQVLGGISYRLPLHKWFTFNSGSLVGAAGGGDVDTGGGGIVRAYTGIDILLSNHWQINNQIGINWAVDGEFLAPFTSINLVYAFSSFYPAAPELVRFNNQEIYWRQLRIRSGIQTYFSMNPASRKSNNVEPVNVDLASLKLDAYINSWMFLSGHALGAATGGAGGYAAGLVGPGFQFGRYVSVELLLGAAGGGGLAVGAGKIFQPMLNLELPINKSLGFEVSLGYIEAIGGGMSAPVSNFSIAYYFMQPYQ